MTTGWEYDSFAPRPQGRRNSPSAAARSLLIHGRFRDTVGARVEGEVRYSVLEGSAQARALVLRNATDRRQEAEASFTEPNAAQRALLWRPFAGERKVSLPLKLTLKPYEAAVVLALGGKP